MEDGENPDDLFQVGVIGLIKAIDNFDITLDVQLSTYCVPMIIGEIRRYLRDNSKIRVSRSLKDIAYKALQYKEKFYNEHGYEPKTEDIAKILEVDPIDIVIAIEAVQEPISIFTPILILAWNMFLLQKKQMQFWWLLQQPMSLQKWLTELQMIC